MGVIEKTKNASHVDGKAAEYDIDRTYINTPAQQQTSDLLELP